ncbi:D-fructose-6-phosphate amidotransferase (chromatophore) [Paulinella micropora]|uniref:Glutamine--fructose-6-phosphate aminotransferase [isomerizing] n=1 Tax=Paulinella micropora TaxID=1928728 RepID=A0A1L5YC43_9EUKA|nr:D-fructose-6-phosphate amidotransferase [Paulinella micropora]AQX45019.1 D-fructose-6-phosphate amidotransferase [Paulinella micropora]BBL86233.1 D-fructose-6-phosphate amidotransferase [Paulinella micropora]
MCGIIALIGSRDAGPIILEGLRRLEYRGYDSAGLAAIDIDTSGAGKLTCLKAAGRLVNLTKKYDELGAPGFCAIGHTRWATHGKPEERNAHPHLDGSAQVAVVQNGIIENCQALKEPLERDGVVFTSDTDTEVIPHHISQQIKYLQDEGEPVSSRLLLKAVQRVLPLIQGTYALAIIWEAVPKALVVASKQAPLLIGLGSGEFLCASDTPAFADFTDTILPLKDGEVALLTPLGVELYNEFGVEQQRNPVLLTNVEQKVDKGHFRHFMLKEIYEQAEIAALWVGKHLAKARIDSKYLQSDSLISLSLDDEVFEGIERIQILACGTSRHASLIGAYLLEQFAGIPTSVFYASEFRYAPPPLLSNTLTIAVTQSGETADTLAALQMEQKRLEARADPLCNSCQLGITNRPDSSLTRQVSHLLYISAGIEIGVAATKTFLGQLLTFYGLTLAFAERRNSCSKSELRALVTELQELPYYLRKLIKEHDELCANLAENFDDVRGVVFLGRGINYPIALEGALKLKEISYIQAEGYPAGEMKHGPIALLDPEVPVVSIAVPGRVFSKVISNCQEAKARDAKVIGITPIGPETKLFDMLLPIPEVSEWLSPLLTVIPMQLLSYHIACHRGLDVDQPRNLAKSVTVE